MKTLRSKILLIACIAVPFAVTLSACGTDPNVKSESSAQASYKVAVSGEESSETELKGFHAYGKGKTEPVTVNGVQVNVSDFAVRSYEIAYMMAQTKFDSVSELPVDFLVQYAFSHHLFKNLNEMNNKAMQYRTATEADIKKVLKEHFGTDAIDVTKSVLYNPEKKLFEMWIPEYGTNIYYTVDAVNTEGAKAEIITTFYNELKRETMLGRTVMTVEVKDGAAVISALKTE